MRILYFGDSAWSANSLLRLHDEGHHLLGVVLRARPSDDTLAEAAHRLGLHVHQPAKVNDSGFVAQVRSMEADVHLSVSYDQILRRPILETSRMGFVNFHAGKLPFYRGRAVLNWALINGESEIGCTAHFVDDGIDTGDIILQRTLPVSWTDDYGAVLGRVTSAFPDLVMDTVRLLAAGAVSRQPQSQLAGTYFPARGPGDEWLDWSDSSLNLYNKIRGITHPAPGARTRLKEDEVIVWSATYDKTWPKYIATAGQVVRRASGGGALVKTGDSTLLVTRVQMPDGISHAPRWPVGARLG